MKRTFAGVCLIAAGALVASACAYRLGYEPDYVPPERPSYVADGRLLIVMPAAERELVYEGGPQSRVGSLTRLTIPFGSILQDIAKQVFGSCFARGVEFAETRQDATDPYVLALEGDLAKFLYSYTRVIDEGFAVAAPTTWMVPEVEIAFDVRAYDSEGRKVLDKTYDSGVTSGDRLAVDAGVAERVSQTLHETLHRLMLQVANDIRPLLVGECEITDLQSG